MWDPRIFDASVLQTSIVMEQLRAPVHWVFVDDDESTLVFKAVNATPQQSLQSFDDVYYRIEPSHRLPVHSEIEIYVYKTEMDVASQAHIAVYTKKENGAPSRADAEAWTCTVVDETVFNERGRYVFTAVYVHMEQFREVMFDASTYFPLPQYWSYNENTQMIDWYCDAPIRLQDAIDSFDEAFYYIRGDEVPPTHVVRFEVYGQDGVNAVVSRPIRDIYWKLTYTSNAFDENRLYTVKLKVVNDEGIEIMWTGFPDASFVFSDGDDMEDESSSFMTDASTDSEEWMDDASVLTDAEANIQISFLLS